MAFYYIFLLFFVIGAIALIGIVIFGIIMFFINIFSGKFQNIFKILKMPGIYILLALILICFMTPVYFQKVVVQDNIPLFSFIIGIPTILSSRSLSHGLKNYKKDFFTWIFAIAFGFASLALCALLQYLLFRFKTGDSTLTYGLMNYFTSTIVGIVSIITNLIEINTGNFKEKFAGVKNDNKKN